MQSLILKTTTVDGAWFPFTIFDIPCRVDENHFVLLNRPYTPVLNLNSIRRGDASGYYEGDILRVNGREYVVCYRRGFYAISVDLHIIYLHQLPEDTMYVGDYMDLDFPVVVSFRNAVLYKYKNTIFRLEDIVGMHEGLIVTRVFDRPIKPADVQQSCGMSINNTKLYFGDIVEDSPVELIGGRVCIRKADGAFDIGTNLLLNISIEEDTPEWL